MKLSVKRADLLAALSKVNLATTGHVCRFTAKGGELALFSEGDHVALATSIKAKITSGGEVCLDAAKVINFLRADPDLSITMNVVARKYMDSTRNWESVNGRSQMVERPVEKTKTIATLTGRYSTTDEASGRIMPKLKLKPVFTSSILNLADKLKEVKYACHAEGYDRPVLSGVCFGNDELAAADGFRLAVTKLHNKSKLNFILPIKAVDVILSLATPKMQVAVTKDKAIFKAKDMLIVCKTIQGQYPKYEQLIPTKGKKITFPTKLFKEAIRAALKLKGDKLVIESGRKGALITANIETGAYYSANQSRSTFSATVPCHGRIRICLIGKQLLDLLDHVPTAEIVIRYEDQNKPILVRNNGSSHVLMPIVMPKKEVITPQSLGVRTPQSGAAPAGIPSGAASDFPEELDEE